MERDGRVWLAEAGTPVLSFQRLQVLPEAVYSDEPFHPGPRLQDGLLCYKQWLGVG